MSGVDLAALEAAGKLLGDGYDRMPLHRRYGFQQISCWGSQGWDLGDWPLVVVSARRAGDRYELLVDVEGDLARSEHRSSAELVAAIDDVAAFYWRLQRPALFDDLPDDSIPDRYRGPYQGEAVPV